MCANWGPSPHPSSPTWLWWIELRVSASWPSFGVPWSTSLHQSPNPCCLPTTENCSRHTLNVIINNKTHPKEKSNGKSKFLLRFESTRPQTPSSSSSGHLWGDASWGLPSKRSGAWLIHFFLRYIQYEKMKHKKENEMCLLRVREMVVKLTFNFNSALMWRQVQKTLDLHCFTKSTTCFACSGVKLFLRPQFL